MNDDLSALWAAIPQVLEGMGITVTLTVLGSALAFVVAVVGFLIACASSSTTVRQRRPARRSMSRTAVP